MEGYISCTPALMHWSTKPIDQAAIVHPALRKVINETKIPIILLLDTGIIANTNGKKYSTQFPRHRPTRKSSGPVSNAVAKLAVGRWIRGKVVLCAGDMSSNMTFAHDRRGWFQ